MPSIFLLCANFKNDPSLLSASFFTSQTVQMNNMTTFCRKKKQGNCETRTWGMSSCRATRDFVSSRRMSVWLRGCAHWSIMTEVLSPGPLWQQILKMRGFAFICLLPPLMFSWQHFSPSPYHSQLHEKKLVCKRGFVNYGKPAAGGSHRLVSCWNYQLLLDKHILLWEPHYTSVLCEMSFPKHLSVSIITWTLSWPEMAFHICK